jgi:selenocysteine lyase/cysteine desulfurase
MPPPALPHRSTTPPPPAAHLACDDETAWAAVRAQFNPPGDFINLENGYFGMQAQPVFEAFIRHQHIVNQQSSYFLREIFPGQLTAIMQQLAELCGVAADELVLTRNLVESMNILLQGFPFAAGDEVLMGSHDYVTVLETLAMVAARKQLTLVPVTLPLDPANDEQIVALYEEKITPNTRAMLLTHMLHLTGQILPVAKLVAMAKRHKVEVFLDSAHAFCQLDFRLPDTGAEFITVNLHKWLGAPLGLALLYVAKHRIADIAPLFGDISHAAHDIGKLGHLGTLAPAPIMTIPDAIAWHQQIGVRNKEARLRYLSHYWQSRVEALPGLRLMAPRDPRRYCAIASFVVDGIDSEQLVQRLMQQYRIFTVTRDLDDNKMIRVTPHLYTRLADLDALVAALGQICTQVRT